MGAAGLPRCMPDGLLGMGSCWALAGTTAATSTCHCIYIYIYIIIIICI
jgi:hypothetical protein